MTDFTHAVLTLREPLTSAHDPGSRADELLATREAVYTSSVIRNPILAGRDDLSAWPDAGLLARLRHEAQRRGVTPSPGAYVQLAFPAERRPSDPPTGVRFLGYDVLDGTDSYLVDYGGLPPSIASVAERLNEVGLLDAWDDAHTLVTTVSEEWGLSGDDAPQAWALFHVDAPG